MIATAALAASWSLANPAGLALLGLAILVIVLHILKPRRQAVTVSSTFLWRSIERPVSSAAPWQKLRWSMLLLAQLLAVALLALAVARPVQLKASPLAEHTVYIIDASGSMASIDGAPDRLQSAIDRAIEVRDQQGDGGTASIVVASDRPRVVLTTSDDERAFADALRTIETTPGHPDFAAAFSLAESLDTSASDIGFVFIGDGGISSDEEKLLPPNTRFESIGDQNVNRSVTRVTVEPRGSGLHARVTVRNHGDDAVTQEVRVDVDGRTAATETVRIGPRASRDVEVDLPPGTRVEAYLSGGDLMAADNVGVAVASSRPDLKVLIAGDSRFWEELFTSIPGLVVEGTSVADGAVSPDGDGYDIVVYSGVRVPAEPKAPFIAVAAPGGLAAPAATADGGDDAAAPTGIAVTGVVEQPSVTLLRADDPLLADVDLTDVAIAQAQRVTSIDADVLVAGEDAPLLLRGTYNGQRFAYFTFAMPDSNLPVQIAFPILGDRLLTELSGTALSGSALEVGAALPIEADETATVVDPTGQSRTVEPGDPAIRANRTGFWVITVDGKPDRLVAVNPAADESAIAPRDTLVPPVIDAERATTPSRIATSLLPWVIVPLLALLLLELWLAWRRLGVGRRQWRFAVGLRVVVAALLIGALLAPSLRRGSDRQATVFVLDGSASLGPTGDAAALDWLRDALAARPDNSLAAVVVFGGDARLDRVLEQSSSFDRPAVVIDESSTDIASALRLGGAVLPADARRRVVLISDGRVTAGDALTEADGLGQAGAPVDVHTVESVAGDDVAVAAIGVPRLARVGDAIDVDVTVVATRAGDVTVTLRRDGTDIDTKTVSVEPGDNVVTFTDNAGSEPGAVLRYQAFVSAAGDAQPQNDSAFAAVPVDGPARILVIEGAAGEATTLVNAIRAGGIGTEVISPAAVPDVQRLASYAGIVMVDVDAKTLTADQIAAITTAVRDLGRGLVTVGGDRSYGVGGYRESPLGDLLPVDSEILDPKRRRTVAEVLSIDTSGSMANCHCAGASAQRADGGVNKTDISRAAAERTIEALTENDEIGVMAWNSGTKWVIDLQQLPSQDVIDEGLGRLRPDGDTRITESLADAAKALRGSKAELKHIILFSDGFTDPALIDATADQAAQLYEEDGITVSVLATGEGAAPSLEHIAVKGHGRFYPGTNLEDVPQIMAEEAVIASRNFITEGNFLPEITSNDEVVASLTASPELLGYVATTAKPASSTLLRIGPDRDPLLATWQAGLGRVTSWTSDASLAWSKNWAGWDGYVDFWGRVVKDTFQQGDTAGAAQATIRNGRLVVNVEGSANFPDGAQATATVAGPDGQRYEVPLDRTGGDSFEGTLPATRNGTYAVGVNVTADGTTVLASSTLASESYPAEYAPGDADASLMDQLSTISGGRGEIEPTAAFDTAGLRAGSTRMALVGPFLLLAALLWPIAVALSRLSLRGATVAGARSVLSTAGRRVRASLPRLVAPDPSNTPTRRPPTARSAPARSVPVQSAPAQPAPAMSEPAPAPPPARPAPAKPAAGQTATVNELLARKRQRQQGGGGPTDETSD